MMMKTTPACRALVWVLVAIGILITAATLWWKLYQIFWWFDDLLHFYNPFALTLLITLLMYHVVLTGVHQHRFLFVLTAASLGLAVGVLWEFAEWIYDQMVHPNVIEGKIGTIIDLLLDLGGSLLAGVISLAMLDRSPESRPYPGRRPVPDLIGERY